MNKAIVIYSGGQDSTTCLFWALNRYEKVVAISFKYNQKHLIELSQAKEIINKIGNVEHIVISLEDSLGVLAKSALIDVDGNVSEINKYGLPSSFVPGRNGIFIYNTYIYALKMEADSIITGVCQTDYSGYPDCRRLFVDSLLQTMDLGIFGEGKSSGIIIETPLMELTKAETFKLAKEENCLEQVIELSHTCYNGKREYKHAWGWSSEKEGEILCPACNLRAKGYYEALEKGWLY
jgi:7-cyano-7-deazaguanine synthase